MFTDIEINKVITDATLDRANYDLKTGELNWNYVIEDVKYFFRDEIAVSAEFEMKLASAVFAFRENYKGVNYV